MDATYTRQYHTLSGLLTVSRRPATLGVSWVSDNGRIRARYTVRRRLLWSTLSAEISRDGGTSWYRPTHAPRRRVFGHWRDADKVGSRWIREFIGN